MKRDGDVEKDQSDDAVHTGDELKDLDVFAFDAFFHKKNGYGGWSRDGGDR